MPGGERTGNRPNGWGGNGTPGRAFRSFGPRSSVAGARDRDTLEGREPLGHRRVAAAPDPHLAVDDDAGDAGDIATGDRRQRVGGERGRRRVAYDQIGRGADGDRPGASRQAKGARVVPGGEGDHDFREEIGERGDLADAL